MSGLWRNNPATKGGKYLVQRRDGSVPDWPYFVLGARDPAAPAALMAYASACEGLGLDAQYIADVRQLAVDFESYRQQAGSGDPDGAPHRKDNPDVVGRLKDGALQRRNDREVVKDQKTV